MTGGAPRRPERPSGAVRAPEETRARILAAAAEAYAQLGYAGCTTRLIATAAAVNEVTVFRLFGSKDALLEAAIERSVQVEVPSPLPAHAADPERELAEWCEVELARLRGSRALLRRCFAEGEAHPTHVRAAGHLMDLLASELRRYVGTLDGATADDALCEASIAMLVSALIADALGREHMREVFPRPSSISLHYTRAFLRAVGAR